MIKKVVPRPFYVSLKPFLNHGALARPARWERIFANDFSLEVEIGFGNGEYLAALSLQNPQTNFVGFEQYCERIHRTLRKLSRTGLDNVRVLRLDARAGLERYFNPRTVSRVHCLYPPPWPKKSDIKHRLFTPEFLKLVNSRLVDGGVLKIVTDHQPYMDWISENVSETGFSAEFKIIKANYGTKFEKKWVEGGRSEFYELQLTKKLHVPVGVKEDSPLQSYVVDDFNPDNFGFKDFSQDGVAVSFKEILYDAKKKLALVHVIACDGPLTQNIRIVVAHSPKGWRVNLAEGSMLMPTMAVSRALECVYEAAKDSVG
jgi:tRNA (guanine-N7-)-methyltransferase